jgi:DNA-binding IclR family transcriptional regulator
VRDHRGLLVGSIAIIGSTQVLPVKPAEPQINDVLAAARRISGALGFKET